jgi:DNA (cytosine-5)-methyltransferase 1
MNNLSEYDLLMEAIGIWGIPYVVEHTGISKDRILRFKKSKNIELGEFISVAELKKLQSLFPPPDTNTDFTFIDLFAGIGGIRKGFSDAGGRCVLTCEWDDYAVRTYKANWGSCPEHKFVKDIKSLTQPQDIPESEILDSIDREIPDHDVLLAGFPCQPFSIAGVSKKKALGRSHGFECEDQGQLFFDILRILEAKKPKFIVLENVKNLKSHDKGNTFKVIKSKLVEAGYWIANLDDEKPDPKIIDGANFLPQHRERIVLIGFRKDIAERLNAYETFDLRNIKDYYPKKRPQLRDILDKHSEVDPKYTLTPKLWEYLQNYAFKHKQKGNGFGFGLVKRSSKQTTRTLSARYYKDGSEILIDQEGLKRSEGRPRRLTPQECARLMGFYKKGEPVFKIPVSDTRAYKQFGNSVIVPVFEAIAKLMKPYILNAKTYKSVLVKKKQKAA